MIFAQLELLDEHPDWQRVLAAYREVELDRAEKRARAETASKQELVATDSKCPQERSADRWVPRIASVDEVPDEELSCIHGKLIAFGFLNFTILGRSDGIGYELTRLGRQGAMPTEERVTDCGDGPTDAHTKDAA